MVMIIYYIIYWQEVTSGTTQKYLGQGMDGEALSWWVPHPLPQAGGELLKAEAKARNLGKRASPQHQFICCMLSSSDLNLNELGQMFRLDLVGFDMSHSQMLGKFEYGGGPIFKVVLEC